MKLIVIEGAGKVKTIEKYLGAEYRVFATKGHIRDLPKKSLAVNVKNRFEPRYEVLPDKNDIVNELKKLSEKADGIYLATDPDREGEAISWHIANVLGIDEKKPVRVVFNEISQKAVTAGLNKPRAINKDLVDAQQARRVLDRLVGYKLSPVLCKKIRGNLSAGRVQSVTLELIVEREREIRNFKPVEYWPFAAMLFKDDIQFKAALFKENGKTVKLSNKEDVDRVLSGLENARFVVSNVKKSVTKSHAPAPFITSTMQQDALNKLGMSLAVSSKTAQTLYEGIEIQGEGKVALITYIRTDSTRVSPDAQEAARAYIKEKFGEKFVPDKPNVYAAKKSAQDAHEAIRPISVIRTPESVKGKVSSQQYELYKLIYERFLASQMSEAQYNSVAVEFAANNFTFKVNGKTPLFQGYTAVYSAYEEKSEKDEDDKNVRLPVLNEGEEVKFIEYKYEQKFTKPPARYTEASLVKLMEEKGIGRPATYVPTVTLLFNREYTVKEGRYIMPTELGETVTDMLIRYFPEIMDVGFTADMERKLDGIEEGGIEWQKVVENFYEGFEDKIAIAQGDSFSLKEPDVKSDVVCEVCGRQMVLKTGRYGKFLACPGFPKCKNTKAVDENGNVIEKDNTPQNAQNKPAPQETDEKCDKCGSPMVLREGRYGQFLACSAYPKCKNIKNIKSEAEAENADYGSCPKCGKPIKRITRRSVFYGCTGYPECDFTANNPVAKEKCEKCGSYMTLATRKDGTYRVCGNKDCGHSEKV